MENIIYLDTHILVWLYSGNLELFSEKAKTELTDNNLMISPIVELELQYLFEIEKISVSADEIINLLQKEINLKKCNLSFASIIDTALHINWTRDPFDRIITAHASVKNSKLLTKDRTILEKYKFAIW